MANKRSVCILVVHGIGVSKNSVVELIETKEGLWMVNRASQGVLLRLVDSGMDEF